MTLYFITGNKAKFEEVKSILPFVEQLDIDLSEIQEIDAREIIRKKLLEALSHAKGEFIVEDTSLYLGCLNGLPGPLIKWFLKTIGNPGLAQIAEYFKNTSAVLGAFSRVKYIFHGELVKIFFPQNAESPTAFFAQKTLRFGRRAPQTGRGEFDLF